MNKFPNQKDLEKILERYLSGKANPDEIRFIEAYYHFLGETGEDSNLNPAAAIQDSEQSNFEAIKAKIATARRPKVYRLYKYLSAAAVLVLVFSGIYFFKVDKTAQGPATARVQKQYMDILPGKNKAVLTLANGAKVILDENTSSDISDRDGIKISKEKDGQLVYTILNNKAVNKSKAVAYNTIATPNGGQYQVILPDGTKVWLNAASSLKYPEVFRGRQRRVELTGEAYFEVAKNKSMPFRVQSRHQEVEVFGTHFNINSYADDNTVKTTLLEGSVLVRNARLSEILKPGQQAVSYAGENALIQVKTNVDTDDETAWKNGLFQFNDEELKLILRQLERWYDVSIDYANVPAKRYNGMVSRNSKLSDVLKMLEKTGNIRFQLEAGRRLKVLPQK